MLTDFQFLVFTHDNVLYLQFICCMFCNDMFCSVKNRQGKLGKQKLTKFVEDSFNKVSSRAKT